MGAFTLHSEGVGKKALDYRDEISLGLEREFGKSSKVRKLAAALADRVTLHSFETLDTDDSIPALARNDIRDGEFVKKAVESTLSRLLPTYKLPRFHFRLIDTGFGFVVDANLDYNALNVIYHKSVPEEHSSLSSAYLLAHILDARADLYFAAHYMAEPVTSSISSDIIGIRHFDFLRRRLKNMEEAELFTNVVAPDFPTIGEALNSGERSFAEFLVLLDKAAKFKEWIQKTNPDAGLIREYHKPVTATTWADRLGPKSVRFAVATGLGMLADMVAPTGLGTAAGMAIGAADALMLDRLIKGWRPNQFINDRYQPFVRPATNDRE
jgi:hypothetical protein